MLPDKFLALLLVVSLVVREGLTDETAADGQPLLKPDSSSTCASDQFRCTSGQCIHRVWQCDGHVDCKDGSDETLECLQNQICRPEQFQCALTQKCLPTGWVCDEEADCGTSPEFGEDRSDEDPKHCRRETKCPWNQAKCGGDTQECVPLNKFCDGHGDCANNGDERSFCKNASACDRLQCTFQCKPTQDGPRCYCPEGQRPDGNKCVDADECELDVCAQLCRNMEGSFECSCVSGYEKNGTDCKALNTPSGTPPSLIFSTQLEIRRINVDGQAWPGNSSFRTLNTNALEFVYNNKSICFIHHIMSKASLVCINADNFTEKWELQPRSDILEIESVQQLALDWVSGNWYFLDDRREIIILCSADLKWCRILIEMDLSKPRALALDPTRGYIFFTKWGNSPPMLERCRMDGSERKAIVDRKIVYPYGVTVDFPTKQLYWLDTYLDFIERVDYDGKNRKTIIRGAPVQNLYGISVFENKLYMSSWYNNSLLELNKVTLKERKIISHTTRPFNVFVYHRQRQPIVAHPCSSPTECDHLCLPLWNADIALKKCICASGYVLNSNNKCVVQTPPSFLLLAKAKPASIQGLDLATKNETMVPISGLQRPVAVDYDVATRSIIYSDLLRNVIESVKVNDTSRKTVLQKDVSGCDGLAVDWISRNLYWTDQKAGLISVLKLANTSQSRILVRNPLYSPLSIALDPKRGVMYWADWSSLSPEDGRIFTAQMDGKRAKIFVGTDVHWPGGLVLDFVDKRLYWCDRHLHTIESIDFGGTARRIEVRDGLDMPSSLVLGPEQTFYYTEYAKGAVMTYNKKTGFSHFHDTNPPLYDLKLYDSKLQKGENACSNNTKSCPELCLPTPGGAVCECSDGYQFANNTCVRKTNYSLSFKPCLNDEFQCRNKKQCIHMSQTCDGTNNCEDGSDESNEDGGPCPEVTCERRYLKCDKKLCVPSYWICDGEKDCVDGTDEQHCTNECSATQFKCEKSKRCIPALWKCDSVFDCGPDDHSDESHCETKSCELTEFTCQKGGCIPIDMYCDGSKDCKDGSDEINCKVCESTQIYCVPTNTCLPLSKRCDTKNDCPDGSDERDCRPKECGKNQFACENFECIPKIFVCDGDIDCADNSDESHCDPLKINNATSSRKPTPLAPSCEYPSRLCDNNTKCITVDQLCDSHPDCDDGSDEGLRCSELLCDYSFICSHHCHNAPEGLVCYCPPHLHLQADRTHCLDTHPCESWGVCSQVCNPIGARYKCTCLPGYFIEEDGFTCKSIDPSAPYVIFSNRHELKGVDLHTFNVKSFISSLKNTIALDFYHMKTVDMVFWTDVIDDKIYRGTVVGGSLSNIEVVVQTGLSTAEGLAVDWIGGNLYWVESNLDQIEVAKLNGSFRRTLVAGDMESPRAVALDPRDGYLFWTDWDNNAPRIERCSLAGLDREIVVRVDVLTDGGGWPNGLTLDYDVRRIYWIDARSDSIHTTKYDGTEHHEVMRNHELLSHPFAIALFENYVYWTDWRTNSVVRANKWTGGDVSVIQRTLTQPFDIQIMHSSRQPRDGPNPCGDDNGGCSHLCLLHTNRTYKCDCPHVMRLGTDNKTCVVNERVLLIGRANEIRGVDILQPYYHTIPTISMPQVHSPYQLEYLARNNTLYWADYQSSEIKRSGLTSGPTVTLIDTGLEHPSGLAIDWLSNLMFVSSPSGIIVSNLNAEYSTMLVENANVPSVAVNPKEGRLYWISSLNKSANIESSSMDTSDRKIIVENLGVNSKSLSVDLNDRRLYWVTDYEIYYSNLDGTGVTKLNHSNNVSVAAATVYRNLVYYADDDDQSIHSINKTTGQNDTVLRNNTGGVLSLRIYDPLEQKGSHPCATSECEHLCLPTSAKKFTCRCATGYFNNPLNSSQCVGVEEFIFYTISWEIRGLPLDGSNNTQVLGPISRVSMATAIDFLAQQDLLFWADSDHGSITSIKRDGTQRKYIIEPADAIDSVPVDWLTGLAIDWIAGNMYWCDSRRGFIEVARLDGSNQHVLLSNEIGKPTSIVVDPQQGVLVWAGGAKIEVATLDGNNRKLIVNNSHSISDVALDSASQKIYFCDSGSNTIEVMFYNGTGRSVLLNDSLENPIALTAFEDKLFWIDTTHNRGSIKEAPINDLSNYKILMRDLGDSLKDIQIFSKRKQIGANPCGVNNGGCQQLCLFDGRRPNCVCSHGRIATDGKSCEAFESFVMYSRVVSIESIQMLDDDNLQNAPHPSIKNNTMLKNAIGLAFSYKHQRLFYSDIQRGSINAVYYNGSDHKIIVEGQGSVEGLAYEQVHRSLYWTCNNHATINRVNLTQQMTNSSQVEEIIRLRSQDKPRGIAVDSCGNRVFWSNWNSHQPSIERAYLTGYGRQAIINTDIRMPNALTLDHKAQKLYWGDARLDKIERCEYDGSNRIVLAKVTPQHPFALAVYMDYIYWTDWMLHAVLRADKLTGQNVVYLRRDIARPMGIVTIANDTDDCFSNPCLILNGGCEEVCSLTVSAVVRCSCMDGRVLAEDGKRCYSKPTTCQSNDTFRCSDGGCVPFVLTCDGIPHCSDKSDEEPGYCGHRICPVGWFQCKNKRCIPFQDKCNQVDDCGDSSDEIDCTCLENYFRCTNGECISNSYVCDQDPDCPNAIDEMNCEKPNCTFVFQDVHMVNCEHTTACLHKDWFCDDHNDCWDNSDEKNCTKPKECDRSQFRCSNGTCIRLEARCDGKDDCKDAKKPGALSSDEFNCRIDIIEGHCQSTEFMCTNSTCIPLSWHCNGVADCSDGSDEKDCIHPCRSDSFRCTNGECIPLQWQCDGSPDCSDRSDEGPQCSTRECPEDEFRCNDTGRCIPLSWLCDGDADCLDHADEHKDLGCGPCKTEQFRCASGACISRIYYCDGDRDCNDGSDEPQNCHKECAFNEFKCKNGLCIMSLFRCNGNDECGDGSDEGDECQNDDFCKKNDYFRCTNGVCINETLLCDGENDCGDFSDETKCRIDECSASPNPCAQICVDKPVGYECKCNSGYKVSHKDPHLCEDIDECATERPCSQHCRNVRGSYVCSCADGYSLHFDKHTCRVNSTIPASLILANRYYIRKLDLDGHSTIVAHNISNAVALDFDWKTQCIYWSDVTQLGSSIRRLCNYSSNSSAVQVLHSATLQNPDGLAVDWVGRNLYWCDKGLDTIEISALDGKYRRVLISKNLEEPRAIALDPLRRYMYWTDWGTHVHIGKAGMDGSEPTVVVNASLGWPNALSVSFETNEIFWADAREDYIAVADLDGNNMRIIASREWNPNLRLHHVFAIDIWEEFIYWTDWETKSIERCHKHHGNQCKSLLTTIHRPMDIRLMHPVKQPKIANPCEKANCSALCLLSPEAPYYVCACPENYVVGSDGESCVANCTSSHFECESTYKCIPFWWKCDTQDDCGDGSDEPSTCRSFKCLPGQFQCDNEHCSHPSDLCNGKDDCGDNSDEKDCDKYTCLNTQFRCQGNANITARCIPSKLRCNKQVDCPLGEDELDCPPVTCAPGQFKCANDKCIPLVWVCDTDNDCGDDSDEHDNCEGRICAPHHYRCGSGRCIPMSWRCDGDPDCPMQEDEPESCSEPEFHTCEPTYHKCTNNKCIPGRWRCDFDNDCGDGSDEIDCKPRNCSESEFRCNNTGRCIHGSQKCDGEFHCDDRSDEIDCNIECGNNEFQCTNPKICIYFQWKCDGQVDCPDGSDEENCSDMCPDRGFKCRNGFCINEEWRCDGQNDCEDGSDEEDCSMVDCLPGRYRCKNNKCVPIGSLCDGRNNCEDGSDEDAYICKLQKKCQPSQFTCKSGHCIQSALKCDGESDCDDGSDEEHCVKSPCSWNKCSQVCFESKHNSTVCKCLPGYTHIKGEYCQADGDSADLIFASEADLRLISAYKPGESNKLQLVTAPGYKIDAVDILYGKEKSIAFWTDRQNKRIQSTVLHISEDDRAKRDAELVKTVVSGLEDPRGIAIDWIARRLYITDGARILVCTIDDQLTYSLVKGDMQEPRDIVVSPAEGLVFWADCGLVPRIETAHMDGNKRRVLIDNGILWPTGLAIDYTTKRLYWADPKTMSIETILFDGSDRHVVCCFKNGKDLKPFKIEVFENFLFVSTYHKHEILKMNKFGDDGNATYLIQGVTRISDIVILQEQKQDESINNTCVDFCHHTELCLLSPYGATCTCADGYVKDNLTCKAVSIKTPSCPLNCNTGTCKMISGQSPKCLCPPLYTGTHCEQYRCSQYCKNKGMCYADLLSVKSGGSLVPLRCNCPPQWTGDRCQSPVNLCEDRCFNGGTCYLPNPGLPQCNCKPGFAGFRCQNCANLSCENGGVCSKEGTKEVCKCPVGYKGRSCEISICGQYGTPIAWAHGVRCSCLPGYTGEKCERDACYQHCQNGGTCRSTAKQLECICSELYGGRRCEIDLCSGPNPPQDCSERCSCKNNGTCVIVSGKPACSCMETWGGLNCEIYMGHSNPCTGHCQNGGICQILALDKQPTCRCTDAWGGPVCDRLAACENYCKYDGICSVTDGIPYCQCVGGYDGVQCEISNKINNEEVSGGKETSRSILIPVISAIVVIVIILVSFVIFDYFYRKKQSFSHERLQENDFNNPMYQDRDAEPFTLDADKSGNFANPVYESVYNGTTNGRDEKAVLLQHTTDETPPLAPEET